LPTTGRETVLTVLGAGTCVPDRTRRSAAYHLDLGPTQVLIDCGPGTLHGLDAHGVPWAELTHVAVTHYHVDHVGDLSALLFALEHGTRPPRTAPLTLIGPVGFAGFLRKLADALGEHVLSPSFGVSVLEIAAGRPFEDPDAGFTLRSCATPHTAESQALRLSGAWGAVGYTGDTGPSGEVAAFLGGCRVLVAECSLEDPPSMDRHLSPSLLADLAELASPELLVVTHVYPPLTPEDAVGRVRARYDGAVVAAADGMRVRLGPEGAAVDASPTGRYT
jgi:ribonuclease BN (tRNA processing enzyme)